MTRRVPSGIGPLDERTGGLEAGGTYLVVGAPGPAKMVTCLQFLHEGITEGKRALLVTNADAASILEVADAWGLPMEAAWRSGQLQIMGFRDDFELRAIRSIEPDEVLEELTELVHREPDRIAVDPGTLFLTGGARTLLGAAFITWARQRPGTVLTTFSVDGDAAYLPSSADWLLNATTGRLLIDRRPGGHYQITHSTALPGVNEREEAATLELKSGHGLVKPQSFPSRRGDDRGEVDRNRLLLVLLGSTGSIDLETWAKRAFGTDVVSEPFEAVSKVQEEAAHGCVLITAPRRSVREAVQACRALRPLTRAAIVFASDEAIRSTDRVNILEAGADDCLSGGLDFRELGLRIRQSMASGSRPAPEVLAPAPPPRFPATPDGPRVPPDVLRREVARRGRDADLAFFCLLDVRSGSIPASDLQKELSEMVRSEEGDLVTMGSSGCLALLQGAREGQLGAFLERFRARFDENGGDPSDVMVSVLSHPSNASEIEELLRATVGEED